MSKASPEEKMRSKGLTFAEKQLKKHGWKKGKGLGKQEDGISEAIKVKVKCDTAGDKVRVRKVSEQDGSVINKKPRKAQKNKDMLYGRFVKAATLKSGGEEPLNPVSSSDSSSDEDEKLDLSSARRLTDEELVQACGGRTAHKGARHGFTMSAKLARLEAQEKAFLAKHLHPPKAKPGEERPSLDDRRGAGPARRRKKAKKSDKEQWVEPGSPRAPEGTGGEEASARGAPKEKKKKRKRKHQEEGGGFAAEATEETRTGVAGRRRKTKRKAD
uniref:G patch domain-containing protein 4 n=1 Tax=Pogona vitticeps TaxID=103695 RepID=A0ABM5F409_9SAUR